MGSHWIENYYPETNEILYVIIIIVVLKVKIGTFFKDFPSGNFLFGIEQKEVIYGKRLTWE
jgi:hypothetical protein